jgi:hypothetical protein
MSEPSKTAGTEKESLGIGKGKPGPGRKSGVPNKLTMDVKAAIEAAFKQAGGAEYLAKQAKENPQAFMTLLGKILPRDMKIDLPEGFSLTVKL